MSERFGDHVRNFRPAEMTFARALIEVALNLAAQFAMNFVSLLGAGFGREAAQSLRVFVLEAQQDFLRQRVHQPKCNKVGSALAFDVRQVPARMNAAAQRIGSLVGNAIRTELELHALQSGIGLSGIHEEIVESRIAAGNTPVAQTGSLPCRRLATCRRDLLTRRV
jgi:hypothetical protein